MFYTFIQNNSGGEFDIDDSVTTYVIVEADSADEANDKAESIGIYFDGVDEDRDCPCCGDRWDRAYDDDATLEPAIYSSSPEESNKGWVDKGKPYCHVYYKDGSVKSYMKE